MLIVTALTVALTAASAVADGRHQTNTAPSSPDAPGSYHFARVEGRVVSVDGEQATLLTRQGRMVRVDLRNVPDMARALLTFGREVEVSGIVRSDDVLYAEAVEVDYGDPAGHRSRY